MHNFKAGEWVSQYQYKSFRPARINKVLDINDSDLLLALDEANRLIGELNAYSKLIPDVDFFIKMHVAKEATESSRIEGTKTEFDEALMEEEEIDPEKRDDWKEVNNYIKAMNFSILELSRLPLSMRLLKEAHRILLSDLRGQNKMPGEIRSSQNWIGGSSLKDAFFIPPHQEEVADLLSDLEHFWHNNEIKIPELVKAAIGHYQFETIHPFLDGNGRIGRLLITLYLIDKKILEKPVLYLSDFFSKNKGGYYDALTMVRHSNNLRHWVLFFLQGVISTAKSGRETFEKIVKLRSECDEKILETGKRAVNAKKLVNHMYSKPILDINQMAMVLEMSHQASSSMARSLEEIGLLKEITGHKRNKYYEFYPYLRIFMDK
jgi:Fic family protein